MKKLITFLSLSIMVATIISCSKKGDYSCSCTVTPVAGQTMTTSVPYTNVKKDYAQKQCDALQATYTSAGATATCTLD